MKWNRNLAAMVLSAALLVNAQSSETSDDTAGLLPDFPTPCVSICDPFNASVQECGQLAETSETAALSCLCDGPFQSQIEACGACILQNTPDVTTSQSYYVIVQLSATFGKQCGKPFHLDGASLGISSALEGFATEGTAASGTAENAAATMSLVGQALTTSAATTSPSVRAAATSGGPSSSATSGVSSSGSAAAVETSGAGNQARLGLGLAALSVLVAALL